jgi:hypothetical protein
MKIVSINSAKTEDLQNIALNVDVPPLPGVMDKIRYGKLRISFEDGVLWVRLPSEDSAPIAADTISTLQGKIDDATKDVKDAEARALARHRDVLASIASRTKLPVA